MNIASPQYLSKQHLSWKLMIIFLMLICFISCSTETEMIEASFDVNKQSHKVKGHKGNSPSGQDVGLNITAYLFMGLQDNMPGSQSSLRRNSDFLAVKANGNFSMHHHELTKSDRARSDFDAFREQLYVLAGAKLVSKRSKESGGEKKIALNYFEIPVYLLYKQSLGAGDIMGGLGPYFAYGIGGKTKITPTSTKFISFDKEEGYKRFDAGLSLLGSYRLQNDMHVNLGYSWGLVNINRGDVEKTRNRTLTLSVMYPIDKLKEHIN